MIVQDRDPNDAEVERLCASYRAGVQEPAFDAADRLLLEVAARSARRRRLRHSLYLPCGALLAVLGLASAGWWGMHALQPAAVARTAAVARLAPPTMHATATPSALRLTAAQVRMSAPLTPPPASSVLAALGEPPATLRSAAAPAWQPAAFDLNAPGALDELRSTRPEDYARIVAILAGITRRPQGEVPGWLRTAFDARDVVYAPIWLTSLPPKRRLSFSLDGRRYRAVVTITGDRASVFRAADAAR